MRILFIIDPVVPISDCHTVGSTNAATQMLIEIKKRHPELDITLAANWDENSNKVWELGNLNKLNIYNPDSRYHMKEAFKIINQHLATEKYDGIHIHISTPSVAKYILTLNNGDTPIYFTMHSWTGTSAVSFHYKNEYEQLVNTDKCKFVFLCEAQMRTLFDNLGVEPKNYIIEPNSVEALKYHFDNVNATNFARKTLPATFLSSGYYITVARLVKSKHVYDVVDACLRRNNKIVVIGKEWINDLDYSNSVKQLAKDHSDDVVIIDELSNMNVCELITAAKGTILFTDVEVCNLTAIESCYLGTPMIIGPRGSGVSETIDNLKSGGITEIEFTKRISWDRKMEELADLINNTNYRYDTSKFPECYKWDHHIDNCYKIMTNSMEFK